MGDYYGIRPVPPGEHPNWCRCAGCRADIARFEARQWRGTLIGVAVLIAAVIIVAVLHAIQ